MRITPVVGPTKKNRFFADFAKIPPRKNRFLVVFSVCRDDQSKERINLCGVTLFDFYRISCQSWGKVGVPPPQFHSVSSVATSTSWYVLRSRPTLATTVASSRNSYSCLVGGFRAGPSCRRKIGIGTKHQELGFMYSCATRY